MWNVLHHIIVGNAVGYKERVEYMARIIETVRICYVEGILIVDHEAVGVELRRQKLRRVSPYPIQSTLHLCLLSLAECSDRSAESLPLWKQIAFYIHLFGTGKRYRDSCRLVGIQYHWIHLLRLDSQAKAH